MDTTAGFDSSSDFAPGYVFGSSHVVIQDDDYGSLRGVTLPSNIGPTESMGGTIFGESAGFRIVPEYIKRAKYANCRPDITIFGGDFNHIGDTE